jgi:hypothetical protein
MTVWPKLFLLVKDDWKFDEQCLIRLLCRRCCDLHSHDPAPNFTPVRSLQRYWMETNRIFSLAMSGTTKGHFDSMMIHVIVLLLLLLVGHEKKKRAYDFPSATRSR